MGNSALINGETGPPKSAPPSLSRPNDELLSALGYDSPAIEEITAAHAAMAQRLGG